MILFKPWKWEWLLNRAKQDKPKEPEPEFSTNLSRRRLQKSEELTTWIMSNIFQKTHTDLKPVNAKGGAMTVDSASATAMDSSIKSAYALSSSRIPPVLYSWFAQQGFIGYQACAVIAQNWLVDKAMSIPGKAALKKGYEITINDGEDVDGEKIAQLRSFDDEFKLNKNMSELNKMNRVFGIRVALFKIKGKSDDYYSKPFNIDGVTSGSYEGITQVDPYWITPELSADAVANPASMDFYKPTWWRMGGKLYHHTHLIITIYSEVADILKPSYIYGGLPLTQLIYERAYAAERTANEGPQLALTKRTTVIKVDTKKAIANPELFEEKMLLGNEYRDNYQKHVIDKEEEHEQHDTALADLDVTIMTQYQLVAAIADVPAAELLETSPKGFNATGEFEQDSYYDSLECIQRTEFTPFLNRHYELLAKSEGIELDDFSIKWNPLKSPTAKEAAEIREIDSRADFQQVSSGAVSGDEVRDRLIANENSGYNGIEPFDIADEPEDDGDINGELEDIAPIKTPEEV